MERNPLELHSKKFGSNEKARVKVVKHMLQHDYSIQAHVVGDRIHKGEVLFFNDSFAYAVSSKTFLIHLAMTWESTWEKKRSESTGTFAGSSVLLTWGP